MTKELDPSKIEALAHHHVLDNPEHTVRVTATNKGYIHEECQDCEWWNDQ